MRKILMVLSVLLAVAAPAQVVVKKAKPVDRPPSEAVLRAMAVTNFSARCAIDAAWKQATNAVASSQLRLNEVRLQRAKAEERLSLVRKSRQPEQAAYRESIDAARRVRDEEAALAAANLKRIDAEALLRKLYPTLR